MRGKEVEKRKRGEKEKGREGGKGGQNTDTIYSPIQRMLKSKPLLTHLFTSWSGRLSNPT